VPTGPETLLVGNIVKELRKQFPGVFVAKIHGGKFQNIGLPDLFVIYKGHALGIEVKAQRPGESLAHAYGRVTPSQQMRLDELHAAGASAGVALSVEEALEIAHKAFD
jgi:hypothetical protein